MKNYIIFKTAGMLIGLFLLLVPGFFTPKLVLATPVNDLFFSEYIEGATGYANNKALEIYNPTGGDIDLSDYSIKEYANGSFNVNATYNLTGTLSAGGVLVICNSLSNTDLRPKCDILAGSGASVVGFNGNDAVTLYHGTDLIDVIGQIGFDPGTAWGTGMVSTADHDLVRKCSVVGGDRNSFDTFNPAVEWDGYLPNDYSHLGSHSVSCPAICGNYTIETGEQCDDGNVQNGDGCSSTCLNEVSAVCGNGIVEMGEDCDGGFCCETGCKFSSTSIQCRAAVGPCDTAEFCTGKSADCPSDIYADSATACRAQVSSCDLEEFCPGNSPFCSEDLFADSGASCSDGDLCNGDETCDGSGNCNSGTPPVCDPYMCNTDSGCLKSCTTNADCQTSYICNAQGQCVTSVCGNDIVEIGEECDDGNLNSDDGCSDICQIEKLSSISGNVYFDRDKDNIYDGFLRGEFKFGGWKVYIDDNNNKKFDGGEKFVLTFGSFLSLLPNYLLKDISSGKLQICEIPAFGFASTLPDKSNCQKVEVKGEDLNNINFGNQISKPTLPILR